MAERCESCHKPGADSCHLAVFYQGGRLVGDAMMCKACWYNLKSQVNLIEWMCETGVIQNVADTKIAHSSADFPIGIGHTVVRGSSRVVKKGPGSSGASQETSA